MALDSRVPPHNRPELETRPRKPIDLGVVDDAAARMAEARTQQRHITANELSAIVCTEYA